MREGVGEGCVGEVWGRGCGVGENKENILLTKNF